MSNSQARRPTNAVVGLGRLRGRRPGVDGVELSVVALDPRVRNSRHLSPPSLPALLAASPGTGWHLAEEGRLPEPRWLTLDTKLVSHNLR